MNEETPIVTERRKSGVAIPILFGIVLALAAANVITFVWLDGLKRDINGMRDSLLNEVAKVREASSLSTSTSRTHLNDLRAQLDQARQAAASAAGQARKDAQKHADQLVKQVQEEQAKQQAQVASQLSEVKDAASTANSKISDISSDVGNVKTEVASTKSELEKTISELKSVRGDLGVQSGLIATNATELAALKALGDRNYSEFRLNKSKQFQKVGGVQIMLAKADPKRNKYTIQVIADDKKVEKKDKNTNEPVQFYMAGARQPYEIVVNEVGKDQIAGYLSSPRVIQARN